MFAASKSGRAAGAAPTPTDASFGYVPLLLETGSASSLNTTVTDSSASPKTVTRISNPSTGWVSPYQTDGYWGNQFNGTNAYLSVASNAAFGVGSSDFTIETWVYFTDVTGYQIVFDARTAQPSQSPLITLQNTSRFQYLWNGVSFVNFGPTTLSANTWYHVAIVRASGVHTGYVNGVSYSLSTTDSAGVASAPLILGARTVGGANDYLKGYLSNFRMVKGVAVYTTGFTPSTTPLTATQSANVNGNPSAAITGTQTSLLTCQSNRFKDNGTANSGQPFTLTVNGTPQITPYFYPSGFTAPAASPGAVLLNGSNQFLKSTTATTAFQFGTAPFTVEGWIYRTPKALRQYIYGGSFSGPGFQLVMDSPGFFIYGGVTGIGNLPFSTITVTENAWTHFAVVRTNTSSNGSAYYINGVPAGTFQISSDISGTPSFINVGTANDSTAEPTSGYIGNFRIVKGTAVYTGAFTPPSGPLTRTGGTYPSTLNVNTSIPEANTSLLLNLADSNYTSATNGVQNNTFIDSSNYAFPITRNGTPTQGSITPYWPNGQWSNFFNGSTDWLNSTNATTVLQFGSSAYTIEGWVYHTSRPTYSFICGGIFSGAGFQAFINSSGFVVVSVPGVGDLTSSTIAIPLNAWTHFAIVRSSTSAGGFTYYINGVAAGTPTDSNNYSGTATTFNIATTNNSSLYVLPGYLSNFRVVKGVAVYTGAFTPPTAPLAATQSGNGGTIQAITGTQTAILTCQSNRFLDRSAQVTPATITANGTPRVQAFQPFSPTASYTTALYGGSGYFGGSPSYLSFPANSAMNFGTGDFTVEAWVYPTATPGDGAGPIGGATSNILFAYSASAFPGKWAFGRNNVAFDFSSLTDIVLNTWTHLAVSRSSGTIRFFINGALTNSASNSNSYILTGGGNIGFNGASSYFTGYMSQIRAVGTAVYTGAFTPPTLAPLATTGPASAASYSSTTNVNTTFLTPASLLLNMTNAGIYDAAAQNNAITVGNAQVSTAQSKWSPTSMAFDGTGDYLSIPDSPAFAFGTGNFTVECWIYPTSVANEAMIAGQWSGSTGSTTLCWALMFSAGSTGYLRFITSSNGSSVLFDLSTSTTSFTISLNVWQYIAIVRNGSTFTLYVDGVSRATTTNASGLFDATNVFTVGAESDTPSQFFNGYIQDLRITKGVARTITAPTAPFPTR